MAIDNDLSKYLKVHVGEQIILLSLQVVKIILPLPSLHKIPNQTKALQGILNYHGKSVPVYNLGLLIEDVEVGINLDTPLILCEKNSCFFALVVKNVDEVLSMKKDLIQSLQLKNLPTFVQGTYELVQQSMWVLDLEQLISSQPIFEQQ